MKAKDLTQGARIKTDRGVKTIQNSAHFRNDLWRLAFTDAVTILFCSPNQEFTVLRDECKSRLEGAALKLAANRTALRQRLQEARSCLCREIAKEFGKGRFDFAGRRLIGGNGLVLQWQTRMDPDRPETYVNQQTSRGCVVCVTKLSRNVKRATVVANAQGDTQHATGSTQP